MDDERFDDLARGISRGTATRRATVGAALALIAAKHGLDPLAAKGRGRKGGKRGTGTGPRDAAGVCAGPFKTCLAGQLTKGAKIAGCNYADSSGISVVGKNLASANASKATFAGNDLTGATLTGTILTSACLQNANLANAKMKGAIVTGADVTGANLCGADLRGVNFTKAQLDSASTCCTTILPNGQPGTACADGKTCCPPSGCVDLTSDSANCGACGATCAGKAFCCNSRCVSLENVMTRVRLARQERRDGAGGIGA